MKKTETSIKAKWAASFLRLKINKEKATWIAIKQLSDKIDTFKDYKIQRLLKKMTSYLNKKEEEYKRKCMNEIRQLQGKPQREYKPKPITKNKLIQFALDIAQENSKLRDTNADGYGYCISCDKRCSWEELAGWHLYSRMIQWICLFVANINAQCHTCNDITWPMGNVWLKESTNRHYRDNLIKKVWLQTVEEMEEHMDKYLKNRKKYTPTFWFLKEYIPDLISENDRLWKTKNFFKPKQDWKKKWEKISALIPNVK